MCAKGRRTYSYGDLFLFQTRVDLLAAEFPLPPAFALRDRCCGGICLGGFFAGANDDAFDARFA